MSDVVDTLLTLEPFVSDVNKFTISRSARYAVIAEITRLREEVERLQPSTLKIDHLRKQLDRAESEIDALRSLLGEARPLLGAASDRAGPSECSQYAADLRALIARIGEGET